MVARVHGDNTERKFAGIPGVYHVLNIACSR